MSSDVQPSRPKEDQAQSISQNCCDTVPDKDINDRTGNGELTFESPFSNGDCGSVVPRGSTGNGAQVGFKKARVQRDLTLQNICNNPDGLDDDDEDDSDWEPFREPVAATKWFCTNCTMVNLDGALHCYVCGEHKDSGIVEYGVFASPLYGKPGLTQISKDLERFKESCSHISASECSTAVGFDERMLMHTEVEIKSHPHPERPDRLRAIAASFAAAGIFPGKCQPVLAREITREELLKVHSLENVEGVEVTSHMVSSYFTPDTYANEHSAQAARLAAGVCADLATKIYSGDVKNGFALIRPPGHHAGVSSSMGFCLHNNAAVAALAAQMAGAKKVLIVDWDVHHGNGTQEIFNKNQSVLYLSLHRHEGGRFYPGTGAVHEVGINGAEGYCVNVPWIRGGVGDRDYIFAFNYVVLPIAREFAPDFTIISAGFDAARGDPLGGCDVTPDGYACMTHMLSELAGGKMLVILEGGYNLRSISASATSVIKVLLGESPKYSLDSFEPTVSGLCTILEVLENQKTYWPSLDSNFTKLLSIWKSFIPQFKKKAKKKRRRSGVPVWWKFGRKRLLYHLLSSKASYI